KGAVRNRAVADRHFDHAAAAVPCSDTDRVVVHRDAGELDTGRNAARGLNQDALAGTGPIDPVLPDDRVFPDPRGPGARGEADPVGAAGVEAADGAFLDVQGRAGEEVDAIEPGAEAYDVEASQDDDDPGAADHDPVGAGHQDAGLESLGAD